MLRLRADFASLVRGSAQHDKLTLAAVEIAGLLGVIDSLAGDHCPKDFCVLHFFRRDRQHVAIEQD